MTMSLKVALAALAAVVVCAVAGTAYALNSGGSDEPKSPSNDSAVVEKKQPRTDPGYWTRDRMKNANPSPMPQKAPAPHKVQQK